MILSINICSSSKVLNALLVIFLFKNAHIFSAGLNSGLYGGIKQKGQCY
jgi:hypothetical protein